jgi:hypothetical protein
MENERSMKQTGLLKCNSQGEGICENPKWVDRSIIKLLGRTGEESQPVELNKNEKLSLRFAAYRVVLRNVRLLALNTTIK